MSCVVSHSFGDFQDIVQRRKVFRASIEKAGPGALPQSNEDHIQTTAI
jgi:hypothetical protein